MGQRPCAIVADVADEAEFAAGPQNPRHRRDGRVLYETPLPVSPFRPWIGMDQVYTRQRLRRRPRQQFGGIAREQPDIADGMGLDLRQNFRHAVDVGLAADEARRREGARLRDQMFAATESDFEPDIIDRCVEQPGEVGRMRTVNLQREPR
jgi:hypothetical protein